MVVFNAISIVACRCWGMCYDGYREGMWWFVWRIIILKGVQLWWKDCKGVLWVLITFDRTMYCICFYKIRIIVSIGSHWKGVCNILTYLSTTHCGRMWIEKERRCCCIHWKKERWMKACERVFLRICASNTESIFEWSRIYVESRVKRMCEGIWEKVCECVSG